MAQLNVQTEGSRVVFTVKVVPGSSRTALAGLLGDRLKIRVAAAPDKGQANEAVIDLLAQTLDVRRNAIEIIRGQTHPVKQISLAGLSAQDLLDRLGLR